MVWRYGKGARGERELIHLFSDNGFSVIRAAGSGVSSLSPDMIVFKKGIQYSFECKAWSSRSISMPKDRLEALRVWEDNTGITTMIAWRIDRIGWRFIYLNELTENPNSYAVNMDKALAVGRKFEDLIK
jgi:Holliday junction resolvase